MVVVLGPEVVVAVVDPLDAVVELGLAGVRVCAVTSPVNGSHIRTIFLLSVPYHSKIIKRIHTTAKTSFLRFKPVSLSMQ